MKRLLALAILLTAAPAAAQTVSPRFSTASVSATTTTTQTIDETIAHEIYGAAVNTWSGTNVKPSADIANATTTWDIVTEGEDFVLEITSRAAGIIETIDIVRTIDTESTTTTLSVFAQ